MHVKQLLLCGSLIHSESLSECQNTQGESKNQCWFILLTMQKQRLSTPALFFLNIKVRCAATACEHQDVWLFSAALSGAEKLHSHAGPEPQEDSVSDSRVSRGANPGTATWNINALCRVDSAFPPQKTLSQYFTLKVIKGLIWIFDLNFAIFLLLLGVKALGLSLLASEYPAADGQRCLSGQYEDLDVK